jgi:hypothetical protein
MNGLHSSNNEQKYTLLYKQTNSAKLNQTKLFKFQKYIEEKYNLNFSIHIIIFFVI